MELLWKRLSEAYGGQLARNYGVTPTPMWEQLVATLSLDGLRKGLALLPKKHQTFVPTPMEFAALCAPTGEDFGLLSASAAYHQAVNWKNTSKGNRSPEVLHALSLLGDGVFHWRRSNEKVSREMFDKVWTDTLAHVAAGGELPVIRDEIEDKGPQPVSKKDAPAFFAMLRDTAKIEKSPPALEKIDTTSIAAELAAREVVRA